MSTIAAARPSVSSARMSQSSAAAVGVAVAVLGILLVTWISQPHLAFNWVMGLGVGAVLQRGRFCFAGAFRDLFLMRNGTVLRAILVGLALATPAFALIELRSVPNPSFGALPQGAHVIPFGVHLVVGGVLFGVGMVVAGGCVSGTLYRIGEGYLASWASLGGILVGLELAAYTWNGWWNVEMQYAPMVWLPAALGYGGAVAATLLLLGAAYVAVVWWESRDAGPAFPAPPSTKLPPTTFAERIGAVRAAVFTRGWPPLAAAIALAWLNVAAFQADHPIGVTGEIAAWADRAAGAVGAAAPPLLGADLMAGCNLVLEKLGVVNEFTMLDGGLIVGALLAALIAGEFKFRAPRQRRRYVQSLGGGVLMGYGAGIAVGCTLGAFFSAIPSLGLNGWAFGLSLLVGAGLGTQIIKRIA